MQCHEHPCEEPEELPEEEGPAGPGRERHARDVWPSVDDMVGWMPRDQEEETREWDWEFPEEVRHPWPADAGTFHRQLPEGYAMPGPFNPRDFDRDPWPLDAGLVPFSMRIPEHHVDPTVEEYFAAMMADEDEGEFDLPPPWTLDAQEQGQIPRMPSEQDLADEARDQEFADALSRGSRGP